MTANTSDSGHKDKEFPELKSGASITMANLFFFGFHLFIRGLFRIS